jgi:hypothetical protein
MKIKKSELMERLKSCKNINEFINNDLSLIGNKDDIESPTEVKSNSTTDSHFDATTQQNGKDRTNAMFGYLDIANTIVEERVNKIKKEVFENIRLTEANSKLQGKVFQVPENILQILKNIGKAGGERVTTILREKTQTYEQLKRFKHDIEKGFIKADMSEVLIWINSLLGKERNIIKNTKKTTMETGMLNRYRKDYVKDNQLPMTNVHENKKTKK